MCYRTEKRWNCGCYTSYIIPCVDPDHCLTGVGGSSYAHACGGETCSIRVRSFEIPNLEEPHAFPCDQRKRDIVAEVATPRCEARLSKDRSPRRDSRGGSPSANNNVPPSQATFSNSSPLSSALFTEKRDIGTPSSTGSSWHKTSAVGNFGSLRTPPSIDRKSDYPCGESRKPRPAPKGTQGQGCFSQKQFVSLESKQRAHPKQEGTPHADHLRSEPPEAWWKSVQSSLGRHKSLQGQGKEYGTRPKEPPRVQSVNPITTQGQTLRQGKFSALREMSFQRQSTERRLKETSQESSTLQNISRNRSSTLQPQPENDPDTRQEVQPSVTETHIRRESRTVGAITLMRWRTEVNSALNRSSNPSKE